MRQEERGRGGRRGVRECRWPDRARCPPHRASRASPLPHRFRPRRVDHRVGASSLANRASDAPGSSTPQAGSRAGRASRRSGFHRARRRLLPPAKAGLHDLRRRSPVAGRRSPVAGRRSPEPIRVPGGARTRVGAGLPATTALESPGTTLAPAPTTPKIHHGPWPLSGRWRGGRCRGDSGRPASRWRRRPRRHARARPRRPGPGP